MRALVTGVAGFVGSHLADALLARGERVVGVDCFTDYYDPVEKRTNLATARTRAGFELVERDLADGSLSEVLDGIDVVFHQAAQPGVRLSWSDGFAAYVHHNVVATQRLLEAVVDARTPRVVYASSSSVYGQQPRYPTRETDLPAPHSPYGVTKLAAEQLCGAYARNFAVGVVSLRYFTVFGPRQRPDMAIHRLCEAAITGSPFRQFGDGLQNREFTYVDDIVAGNLLAADSEVEPGTVANLAGGGEIALRDLIALVEEVSGTAVTVEHQPAQPGDARRNGGAIDRARELFGWEPRVTLREGIERQLAWHRARVTR
ncbi:MAG TPA: NAD-dependent epimerase/dehydratase family protein [Acidimicrobiia bacterium]|nr:NAD-dependent epimerase/dehydratase family protein [Acidimicrobiia bacterium]